MANVILDRWDMPAVLRDAAKTYRWSPAEVWSLTPFELVSLFGKVEKPEGTSDRIEMLRIHNDLRAKMGKRPTVPRWWGEQPRKVAGGPPKRKG